MAAPTLERWVSLWTRLGAVGDARVVWSEIERRYREPHRAYHNFGHIGHCLAEFDTVRSLAESPVAVELAIWFHDAIYDTHANDNEEQSANFAAQFLGEAKVEPKLVAGVASLIVATTHAAPPASPDAALLVDVDLAILGQPRERYAAFEQEIRREYAWVSASDFAAGRAAILRRFLERPEIYSSDAFRDRYERIARENLRWAIERLLATA